MKQVLAMNTAIGKNTQQNTTHVLPQNNDSPITTEQQVPNYSCSKHNGLPWFIASIAWILGGILFAIVAGSLRKKARVIDSTCIVSPTASQCVQSTTGSVIPQFPGRDNIGLYSIIGGVSSALGVGFGLVGLTVIGKTPWQGINCQECHNRGGDWIWTIPDAQGNNNTRKSTPLKVTLCEKFGICQCRSLVAEKSCDLYAKTVMPNMYYNHNIAQTRKYDCACQNKVTGQTYICDDSRNNPAMASDQPNSICKPC